MIMTREDQKRQKKAKSCWICEEEITCFLSEDKYDEAKKKKEAAIKEKMYEDDEEDAIDYDDVWMKGPKVADHCHWTGEYRGPAHRHCNLQLQPTKKIPVFFHNLSGYDSHFIFQELHKAEGFKDVRVVGKTLEKLINFTI